MLLIGAGGAGDGGEGGGSGAVTTWYGAAQHVPNSLVVVAGKEGFATTVSARFSNSAATPTALLSANSCAGGPTAGTASTANQFAASGFFRSVAGQVGVSGAQTASATTFLGGGSGGVTTGNYGYVVSDNKTGFFQMRPIIVGVGSSSSNDGTSGIGCGGGYSTPGGPGMVLIASW